MHQQADESASAPGQEKRTEGSVNSPPEWGEANVKATALDCETVGLGHA